MYGNALNRRIIFILLMITWAAALFELGLSYFVERIGVSIFMISAMLLIAFVCSLLLVGKNFGYYFSFYIYGSSFYWFLLAYIIYYSITILWSPAYHDGIKAAAELLWYMTVFSFSIIALAWIPSKNLNNLFKCIGVIALIIMVFASAIRYFGTTTSFLESKYQLSPFRDYNIFSQAMIVSVTIFFLNLNEWLPKLRHLFFYYILCLLVIFIGSASGSRRVLVLYGPVLLFTPVAITFLRKKTYSITIFSMTLLICFTIITSLISVKNTKEEGRLNKIAPRIERSMGFFSGSYNRDNRFDRWKNAFSLYNATDPIKKIFGTGARGYYNDERFIRKDGRHDSPHNFVLTALLEGGVVIILLLFILITIFSKNIIFSVFGYNFWVANFIIVNGLIWIFSISISGEGFFDNKIIFLILLVMIVFIRNKYKTDIFSEENK